MTEPITLAEFAAEALSRLRDNFPAETLLEQQVMCVAEEAGEFLAEYRRWRGLARRSGAREELEAELADVLLSARVTAMLIDPGYDWDGQVHKRLSYSLGENAAEDVRAVFDTAADLLAAFDFRTSDTRLLIPLAQIGTQVHQTARSLEIDLDAAWRAKAERILSRGWRENAAEVRS